MRRGFTLIELLVVIALISIMAGVVLGAVRGARERVAIDRARADLVVIGEMLETYRREYGDYPQTADSPEKLFAALSGRASPSGDAIEGRSCLGAARLSLRELEAKAPDTNCFVDPWGRAYEYIYAVHALGVGRVARGFVLFSFGLREDGERLPTRAEVVPETLGEHGGEIALTDITARNIYLAR